MPKSEYLCSPPSYQSRTRQGGKRSQLDISVFGIYSSGLTHPTSISLFSWFSIKTDQLLLIELVPISRVYKFIISLLDLILMDYKLWCSKISCNTQVPFHISELQFSVVHPIFFLSDRDSLGHHFLLNLYNIRPKFLNKTCSWILAFQFCLDHPGTKSQRTVPARSQSCSDR